MLPHRFCARHRNSICLSGFGPLLLAAHFLLGILMGGDSPPERLAACCDMTILEMLQEYFLKQITTSCLSGHGLGTSTC